MVKVVGKRREKGREEKVHHIYMDVDEQGIDASIHLDTRGAVPLLSYVSPNKGFVLRDRTSAEQRHCTETLYISIVVHTLGSSEVWTARRNVQ